MQAKYLNEIRELYSEFHVVPIPLQAKEIRNVNSLRHFGRLLMTPRTLPLK